MVLGFPPEKTYKKWPSFPCTTCGALALDPCVNTKTGKKLSKEHKPRLAEELAWIEENVTNYVARDTD